MLSKHRKCNILTKTRMLNTIVLRSIKFCDYDFGDCELTVLVTMVKKNCSESVQQNFNLKNNNVN